MRNSFVYFILIALSGSIFYSCQNEDQLTYARYYAAGRDLYIQHCQNCHSPKGEGLGELIPPLTDSIFLKKNKDQLACIIKNGLSDTITVGGKTYSEKMPAEPDMTAIEIAELVTYITNSFGNNQGLYNVTIADKNLEKCR